MCLCDCGLVSAQGRDPANNGKLVANNKPVNQWQQSRDLMKTFHQVSLYHSVLTLHRLSCAWGPYNNNSLVQTQHSGHVFITSGCQSLRPFFAVKGRPELFVAQSNELNLVFSPQLGSELEASLFGSVASCDRWHHHYYFLQFQPHNLEETLSTMQMSEFSGWTRIEKKMESSPRNRG